MYDPMRFFSWPTKQSQISNVGIRVKSLSHSKDIRIQEVAPRSLSNFWHFSPMPNKNPKSTVLPLISPNKYPPVYLL